MSQYGGTLISFTDGGTVLPSTRESNISSVGDYNGFKLQGCTSYTEWGTQKGRRYVTGVSGCGWLVGFSLTYGFAVDCANLPGT
jgi:hypothetical protein